MCTPVLFVCWFDELHFGDVVIRQINQLVTQDQFTTCGTLPVKFILFQLMKPGSLVISAICLTPKCLSKS